MKTLLKVVAGILLVVVLSVVALAIFIDPNDYKGEIQELARKQAGMELEINGDLGWSLFPTLAISLPEVQATAIEGQSTLPVQQARVTEANVAIDLLALIGGEVKMSGVLLDGLQLSLVAPDKTTESAEKSSGGETSSGKGEAGQGMALDIASVKIRNAQISYNDPQADQRLELKNFNFTGTNISSSQSFPVEMNFDLDVYQGGEQPELSLTGDLEAQLALDTLNQYYSASDVDFVMDLKAAALNGKPLPLRLRGDLQANLQEDNAGVKNLRLELAEMQLTAELAISNLSAEPGFSGSLSVASFALNPVLEALGQPAIETRDKDALKDIALTANIGGPANTLGLRDVDLRLDDSRFTGSLSHNLGTGAQVVKLQGDQLNVDRYLPPPAEQSQEQSEAPSQEQSQEQQAASGAAATGEGRYSKAPLLPVDTLKGLNFDASLGLDELQASGMTITALKVLARASAGQINISELSGDLYEGRFQNSASIDARKQPLALNIKKDVQGIQLGGLLQDLMKKEQFSGQFNMNGNYQARGNSVYDIVHSLDGDMQMNLKDGRLNGVNLTDKLCSAILQLQGQQPNTDDAVSYTEFSNLSGTVKINDGVMNNPDLKASLVGISLAGDGEVDLPQEMLDYRLSLTILQELKGPNCQIDNKLHNIAFPLRCKGSFDDKPTSMCRPDRDAMSQVLTDLGAKELETKAKDKINEKLDDKLKGDVGEKLRGLFGR